MRGDLLDKIKITTLRIPSELLNKINIYSKQKGISKNALILNILWGWLENKEGKK